MIYARTFIIGLLFINFALCRNKNCSNFELKYSSDCVTKILLNETNSSVCTLRKYISDNVSVSELNTCEARIIHQNDYNQNAIKYSGVTKKDWRQHPTLVRLTDRLFESIPPFDLSATKGISPTCKSQSQQYIKDLKELKMWALKMYDANAKIPSGILSGNVNQFGDFDLCLAAKSETLDIKGQYCLAFLQVDSHYDPYINSIHKLVYSHYAFRSNLSDPGHRVPRFSNINWAFCIPDGCTSQDVEIGLQQYMANIFNGTDLAFQLKVEPSMCQKLETKPLPHSTIFAMGFFIMVIIAALAATVYDYHKIDNKNDFLIAFSLRKNLSTLTSTVRPPNDIQAIHGIRFTNAFILFLAHKSLALFFIPYMNRTQMAETVGQPWTVLGRAASLYTDPFIMMAGTLTAYSFYAKLQRSNKINILDEYVSRMFRIVPSFAALIMFCTYVLPWLNSGPQWNLVVTHHSDICKKYWWRNLLFIHNYYGFHNMCLTHTHHIGIDTQLFLISPLLVLLVWKWPKRGIFLLTVWAIIATIMRYYVTYTKKLSNYIHYGTSIEQLFNTADYMYILPSHRVTVYIMGILLGCFLQSYRKLQLTSFQLVLGNLIAFSSFCAAFFGPSFMGDINYIYRPVDAAWYAAFAPIFWCLSFVWIIFVTHYGYPNCLGRMFSWKGFLIWTRISYAIYLTQFPAFFYNVGITRTSDYYGFFNKQFNIPEFLWICFLSVLLTVLFELPFQNIRNIWIKNKSKTAKVENIHKD